MSVAHSLDLEHTLNENPDKLPRGWFSASFFAKRSNQLQLQSSLKWRPPVCQGEGATSRGLLPTTQKILVFNLLTQLLSELFSLKVHYVQCLGPEQHALLRKWSGGWMWWMYVEGLEKMMMHYGLARRGSKFRFFDESALFWHFFGTFSVSFQQKIVVFSSNFLKN